MISADQVKKLRDKTGVSVIECKKALEEAKGDYAEAEKVLDSRAREKADKKSDRKASQGLVEAYIHNNGKVGVLLQLFCETDFVASNADFKELAHDLAMQVAAMDPKDSQEFLTQPFMKNPEKTVQEMLNGLVIKLGENIKLGEFCRLQM